ncbi:MAG: Sua5/YciO/YrdC/YwlC family protein, partial [Desulfobacterota bacterium]|nr:Sua5/YciO/YrdC/YwlC family protein [Thermodesulfobacteriota bacterium]
MPYHIHIESCKPDDALLREAAQAVIRGGIIIYPTETVYGIGALYSHDQALIRVFSCKGRDTSKPILLLIRDFNDLDMIAADVSEKALCLARACWPGPVTLLFKAAPNLSR